MISLPKQTNENDNKNILSGIWSAFAERRKNNVLYQKLLHKIARPKRRFLTPIGDGKQYLLITFDANRDGTHKSLSGAKAISQAEAQKYLTKAHKTGLDRAEKTNDGRIALNGTELLSAKELELVNNIKQTYENKDKKDVKLPEKSKNLQTGLNGQELSVQKPEIPKTATIKKTGGTPETTLLSPISNSFEKINKAVSDLTGKNAQVNKTISSPKLPRL